MVKNISLTVHQLLLLFQTHTLTVADIAPIALGARQGSRGFRPDLLDPSRLVEFSSVFKNANSLVDCRSPPGYP